MGLRTVKTWYQNVPEDIVSFSSSGLSCSISASSVTFSPACHLVEVECSRKLSDRGSAYGANAENMSEDPCCVVGCC